MIIGVIGTDSSHAVAFSQLLMEKGHTIFAYKGGSDKKISSARIENFTAQLRQLSITFVEKLQELATVCDAFLITSVDASQHKAQLAALVPYAKPIFIDKPIAYTAEETFEMVKIAEQNSVPVMSSSALRFADAVKRINQKNIVAVDIITPLPMLEQYDYFYYGIHAMEMVSAILGTSIQTVNVQVNEVDQIILLAFNNGYTSTIRGQLQHRESFQFMTHSIEESRFHTIAANDFTFYSRLVDAIEQFFNTRKSVIEISETVRIIQLLEALRKSAILGEKQIIEF